MQRLKLENGKYAYKFEPDELIEMIGKAVVIDDDARTVTAGIIKREWELDENYFSFNSSFDYLTSEEPGCVPGSAPEDPKHG